MATYLYDEALVNKINNWTKDSSIKVYSPNDVNQLFSITAHENDDKPIKLPLIAIRRDGGFTVRNVNRKPLTFDGKVFDIVDDKSLQVNAIPITLSYRIDVYTRHRKDADELVRNLIFNIINFPHLTFELPYNDKSRSLEFSSNLILNPEVEDNSDVKERLAVGQFTRLTLSLIIDDAYLFDARIRNLVKIGGFSIYSREREYATGELEDVLLYKQIIEDKNN